MGLVEKVMGEFRRMSHSEEEDDYEEFEKTEPRTVERKERRSYSRDSRENRDNMDGDHERDRDRVSASSGGSGRSARYESERTNRSVTRNRDGERDSIVKLETNTTQHVVIMEPQEYEEVTSIADYLCSRFTIFLNLEQTDEVIGTRILDFISGVAYANDGCVRRVAVKTYVVTPFTVNLMDSLMVGLENEGIFPKTVYD